MLSVAVLRLIQRFRLTAYAKRFKKLLIRLHLWPKGGFGYAHRNQTYQLLSGRGLEIGALHFPANVPTRCEMEYCDAHSKAESVRLFPEIEPHALVEVNHLVNLDEQLLSVVVKPPYDFAIMNHVIEHVANPVLVLQELFAVVKPGGFVIVSAPDKEFTFDKPRQLTTNDHLFEEYMRDVSYVDR